MGIPEREEREKGAESLFKQIIAENFPNLWKKLDMQVNYPNQGPAQIIQWASLSQHLA